MSTPSDLERMANGLVLAERLRAQMGHPDLEWLLPADLLPGVGTAWCLPVRRFDGLEVPYLAHRFDLYRGAVLGGPVVDGLGTPEVD